VEKRGYTDAPSPGAAGPRELLVDIGNIAELNTFLVLDAIRSRGQAMRRELGADLRLSPASVSRIVKRLLMAGLIAEEPGTGALRGRTPTILRFVGPPGGVRLDE